MTTAESKKALLDTIIATAAQGDDTPVVQLSLKGHLIQGALMVNQEFPALYVLQGPQIIDGQRVLGIWTFGPEDVTAVVVFQPLDGSKIDTLGGNRSPSGLIT